MAAIDESGATHDVPQLTAEEQEENELTEEIALSLSFAPLRPESPDRVRRKAPPPRLPYEPRPSPPGEAPPARVRFARDIDDLPAPLPPCRRRVE